MQRRPLGFLIALALSLCATALAAEGQPAGKPPRIGVLATSSPPAEPGKGLHRFLQALRDLGYIEGQTMTLEIRWAENQPERYPDLATALVRLPADIIVAGDTAGALAAKHATSTIPVVAVMFDAVRDGLGVQLLPLEVHGPDGFAGAFQAATQGHAQAMIMAQSPLFSYYRVRLAELALASRLPTMSGEVGYAKAGGLMNYGPHLPESWHRAATYVDKILKGAKPADLPVEQPMKFELIINLKTAEALGITIPSILLFLADEVIR